MPMRIVKKARPMVDVVVDEDVDEDFEPPERIEEAVATACAVAGWLDCKPDLCIRFASDQIIQALNLQWRDMDKMTDVLSFPMQEIPYDFSESLGDIALSVPFITQEANRLGLSAPDHCLHLIIHATLHLLGFDHINDDDAVSMQALEREAMCRMGLHNPYPELDNSSGECS